MPRRAAVLVALALALLPEALAAQPENLAARLKAAEATQGNLNHVWTLVAAALVFFMQAGFLLLEAGMVRSKNSINVAQKNIADFVLAVTLFALLGFMLMFGDSAGGWIGLDGSLFALSAMPDWTYTFFIFQVVFCGTAATIVSGAVAERMRFGGYLLATLIVALLVYPVFGHWAWGNLLNTGNEPILASLGFVDFAGSTVVHSVGGWVALAGVLVLGPRLGRFSDDGDTGRIQGHSPVLATMGGLILWIGWIGFNGGSTTAATPAIAGIVMNTMLAGALGGVGSMLLGRTLDGIYRPDRSINGVLGGLVAVTAGAAAVSPAGAAFLGLTGGLVALLGTELLDRLQIDDAVGAIPVHGFGGAWGTVVLAFVAPLDALPLASRLGQAGIQLLGAGAAFLWAFGIAYAVFKLVDSLGPGLRVDRKDELQGLNEAEHATRMGTGEVLTAMQAFSHGKADISRRLEEHLGDESGELGFAFNRVLDNIQGLLRDVLAEGNRLDDAAQDLSGLVEQTRDNADKTASSAQGMRDRMDALSAAAEQGAAAVRQARADSEDVAQRTETLERDVSASADSAGAIRQGADAIRQESEQGRSAVANAHEQAQRAESSAGRLGEATQEIEQVLSAIEDIASKTNMLALNATVEAQRAGEAGKGFAVVASEVKNLAKQTGDSVETIRNRIGKVRSESDHTSSVIRDMAETSEALAKAMESIDTAVGEQLEAAQRIDTAMAEARDGVAETRSRAQQQVERLQELDSAVASVESASRAMDGDVQDLEQVAQRRQGRIERLQNTADAILGSSRKLTQLVQKIAGAAEPANSDGAALPAAS